MKDNYIYTGVFLSPGNEERKFLSVNNLVKDFACSREMSLARASYQPGNVTLREYLAEVPCARAMLEALEKHRSVGQSLIVSDEALGFKAFSYDGIDNIVSLDWISLATLLQFDWDVSVVVVYRRYFDWLPSSKQQMERWTPKKPKMNKWNRQGGKVPGPLFPDFWKLPPGHALQRYFFADYLIESTKKYLPITILNLHSPGVDSAVTNFICNALPGARQSCLASREQDARKTEETKSNPSLTTMYDTLVMAADERGLIPDSSRLNRRAVTMQALSHHETTLNETYRDFPLVCPQQIEYEGFLNKSLLLEQKVLPDFFHSAFGEVEHIKQFWEAANKGKFCHIDTATVLEDPHWVDFFSSLR